MNKTSDYLDAKFREIQPSDAERRAVQSRIDAVTVHTRAYLPIAELRPSGSWAKRTMLAGRKEADLVLFAAEAPNADTLGGLARHLGGLDDLARPPDTSHKAVQLGFQDGVEIDVLPVAKDGLTPDGPSVPRKLRHARLGPEHVAWYKDAVRGAKHQTVCLLKHVRDSHVRDLGGLSSFAIEVMISRMGLSGNLESHVRGALEELASGWLAPRGQARSLQDPVASHRNLLESLSDMDLRRIASKAGELVRAMDGDTWSRVFGSGSRALPGPAQNLGGRTLA